MENRAPLRGIDGPAVRGLASVIAAVIGANVGARFFPTDDWILYVGAGCGIVTYFALRAFTREPGEPFVPRNLLDFGFAFAFEYIVTAITDTFGVDAPWKLPARVLTYVVCLLAVMLVRKLLRGIRKPNEV